jgi:cytochrome c oxidase cbb3-type subunit 4
MMLETLYGFEPLFRSLWVLWFCLLFVGILIWVLRPSRRAAWDAQGLIPFAEDEPRPSLTREPR